MSSPVDNYFILSQHAVMDGAMSYQIAFPCGFSSLEKCRHEILQEGVPGQVYIICGRTTQAWVEVKRELGGS